MDFDEIKFESKMRETFRWNIIETFTKDVINKFHVKLESKRMSYDLYQSLGITSAKN